LVNKKVPYEVDEQGNVLKHELKQEPANGDKEKELLNRFLHANIQEAKDAFTGEIIDLKKLVDASFLNSGRLFYHQRILLWFPKYY